jgi:ectoine hydroxylase-related dioxygenase (phytanoyl-CoA dioxygenase family)
MSMPKTTWHLAPWHQDYYYNGRPEDTLTLYCPLQETSTHNGSLLLALKEHTRGVLPHGEFEQEKKSKWHTIEPSIVNEFSNVVETSLEAGDALLFHSLLPHCARINTSNKIRFVINLRYRNLGNKQFIENSWQVDDLTHAREALSRDEKG